MPKPRVQYPAPISIKKVSAEIEKDVYDDLNRYVKAERERIGYHECSFNRMLNVALLLYRNNLLRQGKIPAAPSTKVPRKSTAKKAAARA